MNEIIARNTLADINILLVEDNPGDIELTLEAFSEAKLKNPIHVVNDGVEAMAFLRKEGKYSNESTPDLVLLDLNMPRKDGREVLTEIRNDPDLTIIPVIILTTSDNELDILRSYELHANCYIKKPVNFEKFVDVIKQVEGFWLSVVRLPRKRILGE